jgi:acylphosphatase
MRKRIHIKIYGRVQGVWFRKWAQSKAQELGISGWVKNESNGSLSLQAEGNEAGLSRLVEECHEGPEKAIITDLTTKDIASVEDEGFNII